MSQYLLKNSNIPFDLRACKLCGARKRKTNEPCRVKAMKNGKCRLHGGLSTGAKTEEGKRKRSKANYKDGMYTKDMFRIGEEVKILSRSLKVLS